MPGSREEQRENPRDAEERADRPGRWTRVITSVCRAVSLGPREGKDREGKESDGKTSDTAATSRPPRPPTGVY